MIIHRCEQGSEEWHALRLGIPTASCFDKIVTPAKCELSKTSVDYMALLIAEWIRKAPVDEFENEWTRHGHEYEDEARKAYEFAVGQSVDQVGFITTDDGMVGASPDGMIGSNALCELKCPKANTHVGYMLARAIDDKYKTQLQGQLWVCERELVDIQSYCPGFPTVVIRVTRDEPYIAKLSAAVRKFVDSMLESRLKIEREFGPFPEKIAKPSDDPYNGMGISDEDIDALIQNGAIVPKS
jgi:hypothetical protein